MKGFTHFLAGLAAASCFPRIVAAGAAGDPLGFILGGVFGLLPDTLDFKFYRYFRPHDIEVAPDPLDPDPALIANAVALAVGRALESRRPVRLKLDTIRLGADRWRQYTVRFDPANRLVEAAIGPEVDTGQNPVNGPAGPGGRRATARVPCHVTFDYFATTTVDIFDGPLLHLNPADRGSVAVAFIPWHREWSHSLAIGLLFSLAAAALWRPLAGLAAFAAYASHALLDQMGYLGSNLWFPFRRRRAPGLQWVRSSDALANFTAVWLAGVLLSWNLYRGSVLAESRLRPAPVFLCAAALPLAMLLAARRRRG